MERKTDTEAIRIGRRIRKIRTSMGLTQVELGRRVGLSGDRIQKYENGRRTPKKELLAKIADALTVSVYALLDPVISDPIGMMHALFEIEDSVDLKIENFGSYNEPDMHISVGPNDRLYQHIADWYMVLEKTQRDLSAASSPEEKAKILLNYNMWKWNYNQDKER